MSSLVPVYSWSKYDVRIDQHVPAGYPGALEAIKAANGVPKMETKRLIRSTWLDEDGFFRPARPIT